MIKTLEERLAERKDEYNKLVLAEHVTQEVIRDIPFAFTSDSDHMNVYENGVYFDLYPSDIETAELRILPVIAAYTGEKWNKKVEKENVTYSLSQYKVGWYTCFRVHPKVEGTCRIIMRATGKVKHVYKYVDIEEPEVEYLVDCGTEDAQDA